MRDLFKGECLRFRGWTVAFAIAHLAALAFLTRMVDLAQQPLVVHWAFGGAYLLLGLLLGLYQMASYRRPSQWLNLLHRPLSRTRIAGALVGAAIVQLALVVALPMVLVATWQETMTGRVVDLRHWLLPIAALGIAACAYLAGGFAALRGPRYAVAGLVFLVWIGASHASGFGMLAVMLVALVWLAALLMDAFRPDLAAPPRGAGAIALALPLQMGAYLLTFLLFLGAEVLWIAEGSHPNNTATPPTGGHNEVEGADPRTRMLAALEGSTHPDTALLREQVSLSEPKGIALPLPRLPHRHELANGRPMEFDDAPRGQRWVFSHNDLRFHGYQLANGRSAGVIGVGTDAAAFPRPTTEAGRLPGLAPDDVMLAGGDTLYQYVGETQRVFARLRVGPGESLAMATPAGQSIAVLSDAALYVYDSRPLVEGHGLLTPRMRIPLPGRMGDLRNLELVELVDGYLLAALYSARASTSLGVAPYQVVLRAREDGLVETVHRRELAFDYPAPHRYRTWWVSPALFSVRAAAQDLFAPPLPLQATSPAPVPVSVRWLAAALSLLALAVAAWRTSRTALSRRSRLAWIVACGVIGLPALASLWLMVPRARRERFPAMRAAAA